MDGLSKLKSLQAGLSEAYRKVSEKWSALHETFVELAGPATGSVTISDDVKSIVMLEWRRCGSNRVFCITTINKEDAAAEPKVRPFEDWPFKTRLEMLSFVDDLALSVAEHLEEMLAMADGVVNVNGR